MHEIFLKTQLLETTKNKQKQHETAGSLTLKRKKMHWVRITLNTAFLLKTIPSPHTVKVARIQAEKQHCLIAVSNMELSAARDIRN